MMRAKQVFCVLVSLMFFSTVWGGNRTYRFKNINTSDGLSQSVVNSICQDQTGFMWFGTQDGLNRYDGKNVRVFYHNPKDQNSLSHDFIRYVFCDSKGRLWIGTANGLNLYQQETETFKRYFHDPKNKNSIGRGEIRIAYEDRKNQLWFGTYDGSLNLYQEGSDNFKSHVIFPGQAYVIEDLTEDGMGRLWVSSSNGVACLEENFFTHYLHKPDDPNGLISNDTEALSSTGDYLWVGTHTGILDRINAQTGEIKHIPLPNSHKVRAIYDILPDDKGNLWIGTIGLGLIYYDTQTETFEVLSHDPAQPNGINSNMIRTLHRDRSDLIWLGTYEAGVSSFSPATGQFGHYSHYATRENSLSANSIRAFSEDDQGIIWIGTDGGGLNYFDPNTSLFGHYKHDPKDPESLSSNAIMEIYPEGDQLWVGTFGGGLNLFDRKTKKFTHYRKGTDLSNDFINSIVRDEQGNLWIGTYGGGLNKLPADGGEPQFLTHDASSSNSLSHNRIWSVVPDKADRLWIGTYGGGLSIYYINEDRFENHAADPNQPDRLSNNNVYSILWEKELGIWLGTAMGLNRVHETNGKLRFEQIGVKDGLPGKVVFGILRSWDGYFWVSTNKGLAKFEPRTKEVEVYVAEQGLQSNEFKEGAFYKTRNGNMLFGGLNGFNYFNPSELPENPNPPAVVLTEVLIFNESLPFKEELSNNQRLTFTHAESMISMRFAALDFTATNLNRYSYKMEGFEEMWIDAGSHNEAVYTNLNPGDYLFRVNAANSDGVWNEQGLVIPITIKPPFWLTWWAKTVYVIGTIMLLIVAYRLKTRRHRREIAHQKVLVDSLHRIDRLKDEFLANTSHELRTPLNGIIGLAESLVDGAAGNVNDQLKANLQMIVSSGQRLSSLVNDILDFSKMKDHELEISKHPVNLSHIVEMVFTFSKPLISGRDLELINELEEELWVLGDENRLQQILHNLIGNAIKFTEEGKVVVSASKEGEFLAVSVKDTGIGIPKDKFELIFKSFEQVDGSSERHYGGTGLGLSITKRLVALHGGEIRLESETEKGSTFTFTVPLCIERNDVPKNKMIEAETETSWEIDGLEEGEFMILVVDDEKVNRQVLKNQLHLLHYGVVEAASGQEALHYLEKNHFDLVLLDIMMPHMSGYEACQRVRSKYSANELPIIFLTAKSQELDLVEGFNVGANDYLTKPFSKSELASRIKTHLELLDVNRNLEHKVQTRTQELTKTQEQLVMSEKMASLGTLTAGVVQEINNPNIHTKSSAVHLEDELLKFKQMFKEVMKNVADDMPQTLEASFENLFSDVHNIVAGSEQINSIVRDLQTFTQLDEAEKKRLHIADDLEATINLVCSQYHESVRFVRNLEANPEIECWPAQLNQAFMNLIINACQAILIREEKDRRFSGLLEISTEVKHQQLFIRFKDNGCGMSDEVKHRIFEPFFTTRAAGTGNGLGLSVTYGIIQKHGGELKVETESGKGSLFSIILPLEETK